MMINAKTPYQKQDFLTQQESKTQSNPLTLNQTQDVTKKVFTCALAQAQYLVLNSHVTLQLTIEPHLLYLKGQSCYYTCLSFNCPQYCSIIHSYISQNIQCPQQSTWNLENLGFLSQSIRENLIYVDMLFGYDQRVKEFLNLVNQIHTSICQYGDQHHQLINMKDNQLGHQVNHKPNHHPENNHINQKNQNMQMCFTIVKNVFLRANFQILKKFVLGKYEFQTVLKCLSYNPFGSVHFDYLKEYKKQLLIKNPLQIKDPIILQNLQIIVKMRYLKDVALCTFIQFPTQICLQKLTNLSTTKILSQISISFILQLLSFSIQQPYQYLLIFIQLMQMFKSIMDDVQTIEIKKRFYNIFVQSKGVEITIQAMGRWANQDSNIRAVGNPFFKRLIDALNPLMSYQWGMVQSILLGHYHNCVKENHNSNIPIDKSNYQSKDHSDQQKQKNNQSMPIENNNKKMHYMETLVLILWKCDNNTKIQILQFVRLMIQESQNRQSISPGFVSYIYNNFISIILPYFKTSYQLQIVLQFLQKLYPLYQYRTRHLLIHSNFFPLLNQQPYNKFLHIMIIKFIIMLIQMGGDQIFQYFNLIAWRLHVYQTKGNGVYKTLISKLIKDGGKIMSKQAIKWFDNCGFKLCQSNKLQDDNHTTFKRLLPQGGFQQPSQIKQSIQI